MFRYILFALSFLILSCQSQVELGGNQGVIHYLQNLEERREQPGFSFTMVNDSEKIVSYSGGFQDLENQQEFTEDTSFYIYSLTKVFTAVAILQLMEEGLIDLDEPLKNYLDWVPYDGTVRQVMNHQAGIPDAIIGEYYVHFPDQREGRDPLGQLLEICRDMEPFAAPGEKTKYANFNYALLGALIEERSSMDYESYMEEHIFRPLNMDLGAVGYDPLTLDNVANSYVSRSMVTRILLRMAMPSNTLIRQGGFMEMREGYKFDHPSHGGLILNQRNMEIFLQALLSRDTRILSEESYHGLFTPSGSVGEFHYGFKILDNEERLVLGHSGGAMGNSAEFHLYPHANLGLFMFCNRLDTSKIHNRYLPDITEILMLERESN